MCRCFCNCKILHARPCCVFTVCTLLLIAIAASCVFVYYWPEISGEASKNGTGMWKCNGWSCRNCEDLLEETIHLNSSVCTNITYLSDDDGFLYLITVDESILVNKTVTDINPIPVCFGEPYAEEHAKICIRLHDLSATHKKLHVCGAVEISNKLHFIKKFELGCFDLTSFSPHW